MADKEKLNNMLDNLINDKGEQAQVDFHDYLGGKMKEVLGIDPAGEVDDKAEVNTDEE